MYGIKTFFVSLSPKFRIIRLHVHEQVSMNNDKIITHQMEQEFAFVDSIITAHTNVAIVKLNAEALQTYWEVGAFISDRLKNAEWGDHVVSELADYLKRHNPKRRGYGKRSLYNMVKLYETYSTAEFSQTIEKLKLSEFVQSQIAQIESLPIVQMSSAKNAPNEIVQSPIAQLPSVAIPGILCLITYTHHLEILNRCNEYEEKVFYMLYTAHLHLKVEELRRCIVNQTFETLMKKDKQMTPALREQYPGAEFMLKDRVLLDFLNLKEKHTEPQLHASLVEQMKQFVLELGKDFLYIDDEYTVKVGGKRKRIDLVFYHRALQCLVAIELKAVDFESEFVSKMDMYLEALDRDYKRPNENPSVGIILCPSADKAEVEYSLCRSMSPTMVAEYKRVLIPREVMTRSLAEYCEFLKKEYKK